LTRSLVNAGFGEIPTPCALAVGRDLVRGWQVDEQ